MMALVIALVMMLAMGVTASAATITINQNNEDGTAGAETYNLYKIFDVTKTDAQDEWEQTNIGESNIGAGTAEGFSYTISTSNPWFAKLGSVNSETGAWTAAANQTWVTLTKQAGSDTVYNVIYTGANTEDGAKAFSAWLLSQISEGAPAATYTITSSNGVATKENADDGYYLITSTLGTSLVLATSDITINTKNSYPTTEKDVAQTNYNVGDKVQYTITVELPATTDWTKPVIVHDTMDDVLVLDSTSVHAKVTADNDFDSHVTLVESDDFASTHSTSHAAAEGKTLFDFTLDISSLAPAAGATATAKTVTITYEAELTSAAAADTEYVNKEFVEYSKYETPEDDAKIKTFDFQLKKTFGGEVSADLAATFELTDSEGTTITFIQDDTGYVRKDSDDTGASATLTVNGDATGINVRGLKAGTYTLTEKTTADGYNLLTTPITVTISDTGAATVGEGELFSATDSTITVNNQSGTVLPSTGGIGTTIFYIVGAILVIGAGVLLVTRRRMRAE